MNEPLLDTKVDCPAPKEDLAKENFVNKENLVNEDLMSDDDRNTDFVADDLTQKLILLFIFEKMEFPLTDTSISEIIVTNPSWLSYMDFKTSLYQLLSSKFVHQTRASGDILYYLTPSGRGCLTHFFTKIPYSIREEITKFAKKNRVKFKKKQEYTYDYFKNSDGSYWLILRIKEQGTPDNLLEIKVKVATRAEAVRAATKWKEKAPAMYESLHHIMLDDEAEESKKG